MAKVNPPRKPETPEGYRAVWIPPIVAREWVTDFETGYSYFERFTVRRGHYRVIAVSLRVEKARSKGREWVPVDAYEAELQNEFDLESFDPIYRYRHATDVVKARNLALLEADELANDSLEKFVWDHPFKKVPTGKFQAIRVWYVVQQTADSEEETMGEEVDRWYLYGRTAQHERMIFRSPLEARREAATLARAIEDEYSQKSFLKLKGFAAWTIYRAGDEKKVHRKRRRLSKEIGFDFDPARWKFHRIKTTWEKGMARKALRSSGVRLHPMLMRSYGGSARKFQDALSRLSKAERKVVHRQIAAAVDKMQAALDARRLGRRARR